jgi:hypothetical protein
VDASHQPGRIPKLVKHGIPFLGFIVFPHHRRLKRRKGIAYRRRLKRLVKTASQTRVKASLKGWINLVSYADTYGLRKSLLHEFNLLALDEY